MATKLISGVFSNFHLFCEKYKVGTSNTTWEFNNMRYGLTKKNYIFFSRTEFAEPSSLTI